MDKTILVNFMKGNYKDCEIEEMTLFIDGILPKEEKENHNRLKRQSSKLEASKNTDSVAHNDALYSCYVCNKKFSEFDVMKKLRFARDKEEWFNFVCEKCYFSVIKKCEGFN